MTKPISPEEVYEHARSVPPEVFEAFNECILRNFSLETGEAVFPKSEVVDLVKSKLGRGGPHRGVVAYDFWALQGCRLEAYSNRAYKCTDYIHEKSTSHS